uniref:NADH:ubiquinone reductase (H(+)-translocating) n=1 Tax=Trichobilharzia regenti TaxID=157069 RepID=A7J1L7_TRIRE|nr:NADH dehydrogenase subunit 5 [Trichobilharzia regenti]ABG91506.1 NADH dehydrogenase subunit 5 [Trichobilharzia regenti]BAV82965.1 NADH dehydrogenase subunit 5 [Trichobilharzia regenti]
MVLFFCFLLLIFAWLCVLGNFSSGGCSFSLWGGCILSSYFNFDFGYYDSIAYLVLMLLTCSTISLLFNYHYFGGYNINSVSLAILLCVFIFIMFTLVMTNSLFSSLVFWEYLGLVSFLLVAFYDTGSSLRGSIITLVSSRFGDVAFFLLLSFVFWGGGIDMLYICIFCWIIIASKSACFPFSSWLLEAMRAPTPVSSLVHSSTLVAAGTWFLVCYSDKLYFSCFGYLYIFMIACCILTILYSGLSALNNWDVKQVVALSTCNNISWVLLFGLHGDTTICVLQLMIHAISKCLLFTCVGDYILSSYGGQSANQMSVGYYSNFFLIYILLLLFGLSGLPFVGLYFSKHIFLSTLCCYNVLSFIILLFLWFCLILTCAYCTRLFLFFFCREVFSSCVLRVSFNAGWIILLTIGVYSVFLIYDVEYFCLGFFYNIFLLFSILIGFYVGGVSCINILFGSWVRFLFGQDLLVQLFEHLFLLCSRLASISLFRWEWYMISFVGNKLHSGVGWFGGVYFGLCSVFFGLFFIFVVFVVGL